MDFYHRMREIGPIVKRLRDAKSAKPWNELCDFQSDDGVYDQAYELWTFRDPDADHITPLAAVKGIVAKNLAEVCPDHPSAIADLIVNQWGATKPRVAEIERDMGTHPQVAFALAKAYRSEGRLEDAERMLEQVIAISPDPELYDELADMAKQRGDVDAWLTIKQKYLDNSEDFGLEHARKNEELAYAIMRMHKCDRALPYAKRSADSGSAWGCNVYAACLTEMGCYEEAEQTQRENQERYDNSFDWYRWCQLTGHGNLDAARKASGDPREGDRSVRRLGGRKRIRRLLRSRKSVRSRSKRLGGNVQSRPCALSRTNAHAG